MKVTFDEQRWQQIQENLEVAQLCGENAGKLQGYAKGALQRAAAALIGQREPSPEERRHTVAVLKKLRNNAREAAQGFAAAVALLNEEIARFGPSSSPRRRRG